MSILFLSNPIQIGLFRFNEVYIVLDSSENDEYEEDFEDCST